MQIVYEFVKSELKVANTWFFEEANFLKIQDKLQVDNVLVTISGRPLFRI